MNEQEIRELFKKYDVFLSAKDVWAVQGNPVIKHAALERLAATLLISFDPPTVLRAERDEAVLIVTGRKQNIVEWSIGESVIDVNYKVSGKQAAYVYAMAEKRGRDRVILKLARLYGAYSSEEADDFRPPQEARQEPQEQQEPRRRGRPPKAPPAPPENIVEVFLPAEEAEAEPEPEDLVEYADPDTGELRHVTVQELEALTIEDETRAKRKADEEAAKARAERAAKAEALRKQLAELDGSGEPGGLPAPDLTQAQRERPGNAALTDEQRKANAALTANPLAIPAFLKRERNGPEWPDPLQDPDSFIRRLDSEMSKLTDPDLIQGLFDIRCSDEIIKDAFPPDIDEMQATLKHHMKRVEP